MATVKVTFTFDAATIARLQDASSRLSKPKSEVVREAILEFHDRIGHLSERERLRLLRTFDEVVPRIPSRSVRDVENELRSVRRARRSGGRASSPGRRNA
jgi:hypothetical protein